VDALSLVLGGRAQVGLLRSGVEEAVVEALFLLPPGSPVRRRLLAAGLPVDAEEGQLVVRRILSRSGRHRLFLNGSPATLTMLREVAADLIDISSQHEHQSLLRPAAARAALDACAGLGPLVAEAGLAWRRLADLRGELAHLRDAARERESRLDYLRFQLDEIDGLDPQPGEDQRLHLERERLRHAQRLVEGAGRGIALLYEDDDSLVGRLGELTTLLAPLARIDQALAPALDRLAEAEILLEEAVGTLRDYQARLELDPARSAEVEERLFRLEHLLRKHGPELEQLLQRRAEMAREVSQLSSATERLDELARTVAQAEEQLAGLVRRLSAARRRAATGFGEQVGRELAGLGMPEARFAVTVLPLAAPGEHGADEVDFLFGPNPGEESRPLRRIASGGELSRVMLAVKRVLVASDPVASYLYDEVDTGVSGPVAEAIGRLLQDSAREHQVLCITHHAQVAARADQHLVVRKVVRPDGRTVSTVALLDRAARVEELARMLGGAVLTEVTRRHAQELLDAR
jgi:DNA repair protein RecN (Recombination protein N)